MTDASDLARHFLALWEEYLTAFLSDPSQVGLLQGWVKAVAALAADTRAPDHGPDARESQTGSPADTASVASPSDERNHAVAELARRVGELEERMAAIERRRPPVVQARRRNRQVRAR